jgi:hypothetical protein
MGGPRQNSILRESALYFAPGRVQKPLRRVWTRWAKALDLWDRGVRTARFCNGVGESLN